MEGGVKMPLTVQLSYPAHLPFKGLSQSGVHLSFEAKCALSPVPRLLSKRSAWSFRWDFRKRVPTKFLAACLPPWAYLKNAARLIVGFAESDHG